MSTDAAPAAVVFPRVQQSAPTESRDRGYVQGHAAGYAAGLRAAAADQERQAHAMRVEHDAVLAHARESAARATAVLQAAAAAFQQRFALVLQDSEQVLAAGALELAEAVLGYEMHDGDRTARAALHRALGGSTSAAPAAVRLHPADIALLDGATADTAVDLVPDPSLARGDAIAVYPDGWLDARLHTAVARARAALLGPDNVPGGAA
ncbi:FliH/SctL family protein [Pseudarthrobacter sp. lyk4-40-TYG-27]|uniref:FliH/SctL family protein n=1 Tax=Pseudarthrobacter sp. lyk4-40-TYG-27 TaxID=3040305 RepID=UPI002554BD16|nr:FliH/SctL family protein [Pseudarthrobacter sp. lyk4-40-TYG-27]